MISTGVYGFPKDKALQIAVAVFSQFLLENEMQIILVVFDKKSFQLSGQIVGEIDCYIDANYVKESRKREYFRRSEIEYFSEEDALMRSPIEKCMSVPGMSLEDELENVGASFHDRLFELIAASNLDNKDIWKRANLDRKHFSKIQCDENYHPKKKTV